MALVEFIKKWAVREEAVPARIALAWLMARKRWIVPIPGTTKLHRLEENLGSTQVELALDDLRDIETSFAKIPVQGARLPEQVLQ